MKKTLLFAGGLALVAWLQTRSNFAARRRKVTLVNVM